MNTSEKSKIFNRSNIIAIFTIVVVAAALSFIYNLLQPNPMPLVYTPPTVDTVSSDELFNKLDGNGQSKADTIHIANEPINKLQDTTKIQKPDTSKQNTPKESETITAQANTQLNLASDATNPKVIKSVNYQQMKKIVGNSDFVIIDARRPEDYAKAHIPGAINIFALAEPNEKFDKIFSIPPGKKYIIYCDGGNCDLSHQLAEEFVHSFNFKNVYIYEGGWEEWSKQTKEH